MKPILMAFFVFAVAVNSYAQGSQPDPVVCVVPNAEFDNSTHFVPFMKMEAKADHVKVTVLQTPSGKPVSEKLYPYYIPEIFMEDRSNYNWEHQDSALDEEGYPLPPPSRLAFTSEPGQLITLSDVYNQQFLMWGDYNLVNFAFDPKGEDYIGFQYWSPYNENLDRVVGDTYYCNYRDLDDLFYSMSQTQVFTSYETPQQLDELDPFYQPIAFELEIQKYFKNVFCSPNIEDYYDPEYGDRYNACPKAKRNLLWVLYFMENYKHEFDFAKLRETSILVGDYGGYPAENWDTDQKTGLKYLQIDPQMSKVTLMELLKKEISGIEVDPW